MTTRNTKAKQAVAKILQQARHPLTLAECCEQIKAGGFSIHRTTIFRELERLNKNGSIQTFRTTGVTRYELVNHGEHHHHAICRRCDRVIELQVESILLEMETVLKKEGFFSTAHSLEFFGHCQTCSL